MFALFLLLLTAVRLLVAAVTPLAPDETYYWVWSRALQPGYLDHPPAIAVWIRLGTALVGENALGVRLLGPLAAAAGSWMLADAANRLYPGEGRARGVWAAVLLNATLMLGAGAVTATPDTPLLFFSVGTLWALSRVDEGPGWWLAAGLFIGLGMASKYTGALLAVAPVLVIAVQGIVRGRWGVLRVPAVWAGGVIAVLLFAPVVWWNAAHGWVSFAKQGGRTGDWVPQQAAQHLGELLGGQVGLATPIVFGLFAAGLWQMGRAALRREAAGVLLVSLTVPGLLLFVEHAIGARVQANWLAILYPPLAVGAAGVAAGGVAAGGGATRWRPAAAGLGFALTGLVYLQAATAAFPLPRRLDPTLIRLGGWDTLAAEADALRRANGLRFVGATDYAIAAELAWWSPPDAAVVGVEERWRLFALTVPAGGERDGSGLLLISERRQEVPDPAQWSDVVPIGRLTRARRGVEAEAFRVYRARLVNSAPAVELPRPGGE